MRHSPFAQMPVVAALLVSVILIVSGGCFDAMAPGAPYAASMAIVAGDSQYAPAGGTVAIPPSVEVKDAAGRPLVNVSVTFSVDSGGGQVEGGSQFTDSTGRATVTSWRVGASGSRQQLFASIGQLAVVFHAIAYGKAASLNVVAGDKQSALLQFPINPSVRVTDAFGTPIPNVPVVFTVRSPFGSIIAYGLNIGVVRTNKDGVAVAVGWTAGQVGPNILDITVDGLAARITGTVLPALPLQFLLHDRNHAGEAPLESRVAASTEVAAYRLPRFFLVDQLNRSVTDARVTFTTGGLGGSIEGATERTDSRGFATVTKWTMGPYLGRYTLTAAVDSQTLSFGATAVSGPPAGFTNLAGDSQVIVEGNAAEPLSLRIVDAAGRPTPNVDVKWERCRGPSAITSCTLDTVSSNDSGVVRFGPERPEHGVYVTTAHLAALTAVFHQSVLIKPASFSLVTPSDGALVDVNGFLSMIARAQQADGSSASGYPTTFVVKAGGSVWGSTVITDATGTASAHWPTSVNPGPRQVFASLSGVLKTETRTFHVLGPVVLEEIAAGSSHTCALYRAPAHEYCCGSNAAGQLGDGSSVARRITPAYRPFQLRIEIGAYASELSARGDRTCVFLMQYFYPSYSCWGSAAPYTPPHTCSLNAAGHAFCLGRNDAGQLGDGTRIARSTPTAVVGGLAFMSIATGGSHTCGIVAGGGAYCWGSNTDGQLGNGVSDLGSPVPRTVGGGLSFNAITAGGAHSCGLVGTTAFCWGLNADGQLGDGTTTSRNVPTRVADYRP